MRKPLSEIIAEFEMYFEAVEAGVEASSPTDYFTDLKGELSEKVDGWIDYLEGLDVLLSHLEGKRDYFAKKMKVLLNLREKKKEYLAILLSKSGLPEIKGSDQRIVLRKNSIPALNFNVPISGVKYTYVIPNYHVELADQFPEFFSLTSQYVLDAESLKKSMVAGRKINFASLEYGNHVRII